MTEDISPNSPSANHSEETSKAAKPPVVENKASSESGITGSIMSKLPVGAVPTGMMARLVSLSMVLLLIIVLGVMFYKVVYPFLMSIFLAGVLTVLCQPMQRYYTKRFGGSSAYGALASTAVIMMSISIPTIIGITLGTLELYQIAQSGLDGSSVGSIINSLKIKVDQRIIAEELEKIWPTPIEIEGVDLSRIRPTVNYSISGGSRYLSHETFAAEKGITKRIHEKSDPLTNIDPKIDDEELHERQIQARLEDLRKSVQTALINIAQATVTPGAALTTLNVLGGITNVLMSLVIFVIALYYFLAEGSTLLENAQSLIPVNVDHQKKVFTQFATAVRAVVMSTMLAAGAQGIATSAAIWLLGFGNFFILTIVSTLSALVPIAGTWLVWLPCAIWLFAQGHWVYAILLSLWGFFVVGTLDNIIRAWILQSDAKLHPLLAFISVLGGIQAMGLWGVFIAPIIASCLHALIEIFNTELREISRNTQKRHEGDMKE